MVAVFFCWVHRCLCNFFDYAEALRDCVGRASVVRGANEVGRFLPSAGDDFACNCLGFVRVACRVVNLAHFFCLPWVFTQVPVVSVARNSFFVRANEVIVRLTGRSM